MQTQAEYFEQHAVNGELTDGQMAVLVTLPEGDMSPATEADDKSGKPDAAPEVKAEEPTDKPAEQATPVVMAKDGVHTIPYDKLVEAREAEKHWKAQAEAMQRELQELKASKPTQQQAEEQADEAIKQGVDPALFGDFSEEAIAAGVQKLVDARVEAIEQRLSQAIAPLQKASQESEADTHFKTIYAAHPDADSIGESAEIRNWIASKPSFARSGYEAVLTQGTADQVVEMLSLFKSETQKPAPAPAIKTAEAVAQAAKPRVPSSLSDVPGSVAPSTNPNEVVKDMQGAQLIDRLSKVDSRKMWEMIDSLV